jgi:protein O-mannosyl-transferase
MHTHPSSAATPAQSNSSPRLWLTLLTLVATTLFAFWPVLQCDFLHLDDPDYVTANPHVRDGLTWSGVTWALARFHASNWHPMTWLSLMADVDLFGVKAAGMHFTNLLLHLVNVLLVFALVRSLTGTHWRAAIVTALFGLHPLRVESVAWISERKDVLAACFSLLCLLAYVQYVRAKVKDNSRWSWLWIVISLACFTLGLMSKPVLVTLPFVMLLLDYWPLRRGERGFSAISPLLREKWGFFLLAVASSAITLLAQSSGQAVQSFADYPLWERAGNSFVSYARYVGKTIWPDRLAILYPYPNGWPLGVLVGSVAGLIASVTLAVASRRRWPFLPVGLFIFLGVLIPMLGLVQVGGQSMADRYTYLPHVGFWLAVVWMGHCLVAPHRWAMVAAATASAVGVLFCVAMTRMQIGHWIDTERLLCHAITVTEKNSLAYYALGSYYQSIGRIAEASDCYQRILEFEPDGVQAHERLASIYLEQGNTEKALQHYREILRVQPDSAVTLNNIGAALVRQARHEEAIEAFKRALELKPDYAEAHYNLALVWATQRQFNEAIPHFLAAERQYPRAAAYNNLGLALAGVQRGDEAIRTYRRAIELDPEMVEAWVNLGNALARKDDLNGALENYQKALEMDSKNPAILNNLGHVFLRTGQFAKAITNFEAALQINPDFAQARFNRASALVAQQRPSAAIEEFERLLAGGNENPQIYLGKARALSQMGRTDEATVALGSALRLKPDYLEAKAMLQALSKPSPTGQ